MAISLALVLEGPARAAEQATKPTSAETDAEVDEAPPEATYRVRGMGLLGNLQMKRMLRLLVPEDSPLAQIDAVFVEDAIVLLQSALEQQGFLHSSGTATVYRRDEVVETFAWVVGDVPFLPRDLRGDRVEFRIDRGQRYTYGKLAFSGLSAVPEEAARSFFMGQSFLFDRSTARRFTPGGLKRGISSLQEQLVREGYPDSEVKVVEEKADAETGIVDVKISVVEGMLHRVGLITLPEDMPDTVEGAVIELAEQAKELPWSPVWELDFLQSVRSACYQEGYAAANVELTPVSVTEADGASQAHLDLKLNPGPRVRLGEVTFSGDDKTRQSLLNRTLELEPGDFYRRSDVERSRARLSSLGVFSSIRPNINRVEPDRWNVDYVLTPGKRLEVSVLAGYGSYEKIRGGIEVFHSNLTGRAHRGRLELTQSLKSTSADYRYTVPQIFGTAADASVQMYGLLREEVSFDREDYGISLGVRRRALIWDFDTAAQYRFERLSADVGDNAPDTVSRQSSRVGAVTLDFVRDRRDNPITPRTGSSIGISSETALQAIGGEVDYERAEFRASWHWRRSAASSAHIGVRHSIIWSPASTEEIPLGKRFFPGGENTIRGYREGTAAPKDADGIVVGAEVSTIVNLELDHALTRAFYGVVFVDAGLTSAAIGDYPGKEIRVSAGIGLRYNTVIGPLRLEYGHNVVQETGDQDGQVHLSIGYPF